MLQIMRVAIMIMKKMMMQTIRKYNVHYYFGNLWLKWITDLIWYTDRRRRRRFLMVTRCSPLLRARRGKETTKLWKTTRIRAIRCLRLWGQCCHHRHCLYLLLRYKYVKLSISFAYSLCNYIQFHRSIITAIITAMVWTTWPRSICISNHLLIVIRATLSNSPLTTILASKCWKNSFPTNYPRKRYFKI